MVSINYVILCGMMFLIFLGLRILYIGAIQDIYDIGIVFTFSILLVAIFRVARSGFFKG